MPALPLDEAGKYVAAAYIVFLTVILIYVGIMAVRLRRLERRMEQLNDEHSGAAVETGGRSDG